MVETDIERIARLVIAKPYANPREVTERDVRRILRAAWEGAPVADLADAPTP
jgi:maleylacetate reductase